MFRVKWGDTVVGPDTQTVTASFWAGSAQGSAGFEDTAQERGRKITTV